MKLTFIYPVLAAAFAWPAAQASSPPEMWALAEKDGAIHRFSTLFSAQDVRDCLSSDSGIDSAMRWCKETGVTKVYIEEYRDGYEADRETLLQARNRFREAGFFVSGCVTTTRIGRAADHGMGGISCYTDLPTQERLKSIFVPHAVAWRHRRKEMWRRLV